MKDIRELEIPAASRVPTTIGSAPYYCRKDWKSLKFTIYTMMRLCDEVNSNGAGEIYLHNKRRSLIIGREGRPSAWQDIVNGICPAGQKLSRIYWPAVFVQICPGDEDSSWCLKRKEKKAGGHFHLLFFLVFLDSILFGGNRSWARLLRRHTHHTQVGRISPQSKVLWWVVV